MALPLDHVVLPTASLAVARQRLAALGFTVAPRGVHPFGTENCCVYLADGTFLEPLAVADQAAANRAIAEGNVFVIRDRTFREDFGREGFSAVVLGTADATADDARYRAAGLSAGGMLSFSRPFLDAEGNSDTASFRLAFLAPRDWSGTFLFACERVNAPKVDRTGLQSHPNGALRISGVVASAQEPLAQARAMAVAADAVVAEDAHRVSLANATIDILEPRQIAGTLGLPAARHAPLAFEALVFSVADLAATTKLLARNGVDYRLHQDRIQVSAAPGQGAAIIFEEKP